MTKILVVDDNPVDRRLIGGLLSKEPDWRIFYANDGAHAITETDSVMPDVIVTDLQMPYVDGLELVKRIRDTHAHIPVILITAKGSEQIAVEALKQGAASFSPKAGMQKDLARTVKQVLEMRTYIHAANLPGDQPVPKNLAFVLENDLGLIGPVIEHLQAALPDWSDRDRLQIGMAIDEALVNAMHHGNLEVKSSLREADESAYYLKVKTRKAKTPYCDRKVRIQAEISQQHVCVQISDEGPGFDPNKVADPTAGDNIQKVGGRGLFLINTFMSKVAHNSFGNQITMTKLRPGMMLD